MTTCTPTSGLTRSARSAGGTAGGSRPLCAAACPARTNWGSSPPSPAWAAATLASAESVATGVSATLGIGQRPWGSLVVLHLSDRDGPRQCRLIVVPRAGSTQILSSWLVPTRDWTGQAVVYANTDLSLAE